MAKLWIEVSDLGPRLAIARVHRHLTQEQAAQLVGISVKSLQSMEQQQRGIGWATLVALCRLYKVPPKNFLKGVDGLG